MDWERFFGWPADTGLTFAVALMGLSAIIVSVIDWGCR